MNKKFFELPLEKQERIIKAAYMVFAHDNYKNASMSRIADAGGISKSLLFHYFQNKKDLYLYLWENINRISNEIELKYYYKETSDFFEAMTQKVLARCEFMRTAPDEYLFSLQALYFLPDSCGLLCQDSCDFCRCIKGNQPVLYIVQREPQMFER